MAAYSGPEIPNSGLVYNLDAANPKNFGLTSIQVLVVAGGGGGGSGRQPVAGAEGSGRMGAGGGAGGLIYHPKFSVTPGTSYTVTVGSGGAGGDWNGATDNDRAGGQGGNSVFGSLTAIGGGRGGMARTATIANYNTTFLAGGSGGGASHGVGLIGGSATQTSQSGDSGAYGFGNLGGGTHPASTYGGGGGGGAGSAGGIADANQSGGAGGAGLGFDISGTATFYGGGGGGGRRLTGLQGIGGIGGGGNGGPDDPSNGLPGTANTGGGGGGGSGTGNAVNNGGAGGSGIVIVRYRGPQRAVGGTVTRVGNDTVHTFTSVGSTTFTPISTSVLSGLSDFSSNSYFASAVNGPTYNSDNGGSIVFDGSNDNVNIGNQSNLNMGTGDFSLECIFKASGSSAYRLLLQKGNPGVGVNRGYRIRIEINNTVQLTVTGDAEYTATSSAITYNTYYHVMATKDASNLKIYLNGSLSGTGTSPAGTTSNTNDFIIGLSDSGNWPFNGNISQVKIYNRALTAAEIAQLFDASRSRYGI